MYWRTLRLIILTIGLSAALNIVIPSDLVLEEQICQIGPGIIGRGRSGPFGSLGCQSGRKPRSLQFINAAHWIVCDTAFGGPFRDHKQMLRQTPRSVWLEQAILQNEVLRKRPIVWNLARIMITHHIRFAAATAAVRVVSRCTTGFAFLGLRDKAIHFAIVNILCGVSLAMRAASNLNSLDRGRDKCSFQLSGRLCRP